VKTGTEVRLPLYLLFSGKGIAILNKYRDNLEDFFHLRDNSNVNKDLIIITRLAGLSKRISFHTARHTNATLLIYNGINITTVQKLLGHKSVKTTQVYTNVMDMTIIHDLEKMK
jgi:site-specific recombinase XerD